MKKIFLLTTLLYAACWQAEAQHVSKAWVSDQKDGTYINPVLHADYSDPDVCAAGDDFYMKAASFRCAPGLHIIHYKEMRLERISMFKNLGKIPLLWKTRTGNM